MASGVVTRKGMKLKDGTLESHHRVGSLEAGSGGWDVYWDPLGERRGREQDWAE